MVLFNLLLALLLTYDLLQLSGLLAVSTPPQPVTVSHTNERTHNDPGTARKPFPHDWHPFGQAAVVPSSQALPIPETAPDTSLNLTLLGVLYADQPGLSAGLSRSACALIKGPNLKEKGFRVQDMLPGNVQIAAIYTDHVILKRNNRFETLRLPGKPRKPRAHRTAKTPTTPKGALKWLRERILTHPEEVLARVRVAPYRQAGKFIGYQLFHGNKPGLLESFALLPGDVVTAVNGKVFHTPADALRSITALAGKTALHLRVLRAGKIKKFDFSMDP